MHLATQGTTSPTGEPTNLTRIPNDVPTAARIRVVFSSKVALDNDVRSAGNGTRLGVGSCGSVCLESAKFYDLHVLQLRALRAATDQNNR